MSLQQWLPSTGSAISVGLGDALGNELHEFPALVCPGDIPTLRRELADVVAKYGGRYHAALREGRDGLAFGLDGHDDNGAGSGPDRPDQVAAASATATDQDASVEPDRGGGGDDETGAHVTADASVPGDRAAVDYPNPVDPRPVSRERSDPVPYEASMRELFLGVEPTVDDEGAQDLCVLLKPAFNRVARLAWIARDVVQRLRPDDEDEAPSEAWVEDASESVEAVLELLGETAEQAHRDFDSWNHEVLNKTHAVYFTHDDAERMARLCELLPGGINRASLVACAALKLLTAQTDPLEVMAQYEQAASLYLQLRNRRRATEARTPAEPVDTAVPEPVTV